jgi:broad specificity phosphatase PhoE
MYRALQTARPIGRALGLNPEVWVDIHESGGIFLEHEDERGTVGYPGKTRSEILAEFSNYVLPDAITEHGWWDVNKAREDLFSCQGRALRVGRHLQRWAHTNERIALVSHGGFIDALIKTLTSQLPGDHLFYHHFNTAFSRIDIDGTGRLDIRYINRTDHLLPELVS